MWWGLFPGFLLIIAASSLPQSTLVGLVGLAFWLWGCFNVAKGKGYHPAYALLTLIPLIGFFILLFLRDKNKASRTLATDPSDYPLQCRECGHPYQLSDYRPTATAIACSRCHATLPRQV
jgi:hypothetical protein